MLLVALDLAPGGHQLALAESNHLAYGQHVEQHRHRRDFRVEEHINRVQRIAEPSRPLRRILLPKLMATEYNP